MTLPGRSPRAKPAVPPSDGRAEHQTTEVSGGRVIGGVQVGVGVEPDHQGVGVMFGNGRQCRERCRAARERHNGDVAALDDSAVFALQFPQSGKGGQERCLPGTRGRGLRGPDHRGCEIEPSTQFVTHDGCALHAAVVVIAGWANEHDEAGFSASLHHALNAIA